MHLTYSPTKSSSSDDIANVEVTEEMITAGASYVIDIVRDNLGETMDLPLAQIITEEVLRRALAVHRSKSGKAGPTREV
jgi:hypothetical protein